MSKAIRRTSAKCIPVSSETNGFYGGANTSSHPGETRSSVTKRTRPRRKQRSYMQKTDKVQERRNGGRCSTSSSGSPSGISSQAQSSGSSFFSSASNIGIEGGNFSLDSSTNQSKTNLTINLFHSPSSERVDLHTRASSSTARRTRKSFPASPMPGEPYTCQDYDIPNPSDCASPSTRHILDTCDAQSLCSACNHGRPNDPELREKHRWLEVNGSLGPGNTIGSTSKSNPDTMNNGSQISVAPSSTISTPQGVTVEREDHDSESQTHQSSDIYYRHLSVKRRGYPLWIPEPNHYLPVEYQRKGTSIGDVGMLTTEGGFDYLFNVLVSYDHPFNAGNVPSDFAPLFPALQPSDIRGQHVFKSNSFIASPGVKPRFESAADCKTNFHISGSEGAILITPDGAVSEDLGNLSRLRQYVSENIESWYHYANGQRGRELANGDLRLVIGCDKTSAWGMAAFAKLPEGADTATQLSFKSIGQTQGAPFLKTYGWDLHTGLAEVRSGPGIREILPLCAGNAAPKAYENQCVFVRTLNPTLNTAEWLALTAKIKTSDGPTARTTSQTDFGERNLGSSRSGHSSEDVGVPPDTCAENDSSTFIANLNTNPHTIHELFELPVYLTSHPSRLLNECILQQVKHDNVKMVITDDSDWSSVLIEDDILLPNLEGHTQRIIASSKLVLDNKGFIYLERNIEISSVQPSQPSSPTLTATASSPPAGIKSPKAQGQRQLSGAMGTAVGMAPGLGPGSQPPGWNDPQQQPLEPDMQAIRNQAGELAGQANIPSTSAMQTLASLPQALGQDMIQRGLVPPRTGPTPQQPPHIGGQPGPNLGAPSQPQHGSLTSPFNYVTNGSNSPFPFPPNGPQDGGPGPAPGPSRLQPGVVGSGNPAISGLANFSSQLIQTIPPMEKRRFDIIYRAFLKTANIRSPPIVIDGRTIDPHRLHIEVIKEGGWMAVGVKDLWTVIGARLGFMQFPGSDTEPARSGSAIGQQIQNCYKNQIAPFDNFYIAHTFKQKHQLQQQHPSQPPDAGSLFNLSMSRMSPQYLSELVKMSQISVSDLKAQNVDEKTIKYVEDNRATLQRHLHDQKLFSAQLKVRSQSEQGNMPPGGAAMAPRPARLAAPPFPQSGAGPSTMLAPQQQKLMMQRQAIHNQQMQMHIGPQGQRAPLSHTGPPHPGQMPHQPMLPNGGPGQGLLRTPVDMNATGQQLLQKWKAAYMNNVMSKTVEVPLENQMEFNQILETLHRQSTDVEVASLAAMLGTQGPPQQEAVRRFVAIVASIHAQRRALSTSTPRYLMDLQTLKNMATDYNRVTEALHSITTSSMQRGMLAPQQATAQQKMQQMQFQAQQQQLATRIPMVPQPPNLPGSMQQQPLSMQQQMQTVPPHSPPPQQQPSRQQQQQQPMPPYQHMQQQMQPPIDTSLRQPPNLLQSPVKRKVPGSGYASSPSPAPVQAPTLATTPTATASPPPACVKSPKARATPKTMAAATKTRWPSRVASAVEQSPFASGSVGNKRQREEHTPGAATPGALSIAGEPAPPKRAKTGWMSEPTEELKKQEGAIENVKLEEDASGFLDQFTEFSGQQAYGGNPPESLTFNLSLSEALDHFLRHSGELPRGMLNGEASGSSMKSVPSPSFEAYDQFFDLSDFTTGGEQEDFQAPTPGLSTSASSANPSPMTSHQAEVLRHARSTASLPGIVGLSQGRIQKTMNR